MPELPELHLNSQYVSKNCHGILFSGKVVKSEVSKCTEVDFSSASYSITSQSRGKEMALILQCRLNQSNQIRILFRFGMSGRFTFSPVSEIPKHAHLQFFTAETPQCMLSFVDVRRFGSWHIMEDWGEERGPDPVFENEEFCSSVLNNLSDTTFNKPICEAMLDQKYFNGVGNYLRAEILFRAGVPPFACARSVLEPLVGKTRKMQKLPDLLQLCHDVPLEVINLRAAFTQDDYIAFVHWLRCYENPTMSNLKDHNARTIWFKGEAGALAPKIKKSVAIRKRKRKPMYEPDEHQDPIAKKEDLDQKPFSTEKEDPEKTEQLCDRVKKEPLDNPAKKEKSAPAKKKVKLASAETVRNLKDKDTTPPRRSTRIKASAKNISQ